MDILKREAEKNHEAEVRREKFLEKIRSRITRQYSWADFVHQTRALKPVIEPETGEVFQSLYGDINR